LSNEAPAPGWPPARRSLAIAAAVTAVVALVSALAPDAYANPAVGLVFLLATRQLVLAADAGDGGTIRAYGLGLGGLTEPQPLSLRRILRDAATAAAWALGMAALFFPPFWFGYRIWWGVDAPFRAALPLDFASEALGQLVAIALPEEAFYRGYLQSALDGRWAERRWRILGADLGPGWLIAAAIFAVGHVLTIPHPSRLAVFFPALVFGWLRARTGGIGAAVMFHALCNLFSWTLAHGYGLR
jgi:membrane protease YdiL (CAAX protease family)